MFSVKQPKIGLSLSGGAAFGLAHIGVLRYFEEQGIKIDAIVGTSAGAIMGSLYAFGVPTEQILAEARKISWSALSTVTPSKLGMISNKPLSILVTNVIGERNIEDARIPLAITTTDIRTGEQVVLRKGPVAEAVCASAAIPCVFTPHSIDGKMLVDGGLSNNLPHAPLVAMKTDVTIGVDVIAHAARSTKPKHYLDMLTKTYNIFMNRLNNASRIPFDILIDPNLSKYNITNLAKANEIYTEGYVAAREAHARIANAIAKKTRLPWWAGLFKKSNRVQSAVTLVTANKADQNV